MLNNSGTALQRRFERTKWMTDLDCAIAMKEQAFATLTAPLSIRLKAANSCSDLLISQKRYNRAKSLLRAAVHLLPMVSPRTLKQSDRQHNISLYSNITSRAVSLTLADAEDPYDSLQLLEQGRGILASLQIETRSDISILAASHPDLAYQFQGLQNEIDPPSQTFDYSVIEDSSIASNSTSILDTLKSIAERRALLERFDDLLRYIRSLKGFENFLQGPSRSELHSLAGGGPIVVMRV